MHGRYINHPFPSAVDILPIIKVMIIGTIFTLQSTACPTCASVGSEASLNLAMITDSACLSFEYFSSLNDVFQLELKASRSTDDRLTDLTLVKLMPEGKNKYNHKCTSLKKDSFNGTSVRSKRTKSWKG